MTRHPCGCGLAWLPRGGPQDPAETRAPPVFQRLSSNERPGWILCSGHLRLMGLPADLRDPRRSRLPESVMRVHMRRVCRAIREAVPPKTWRAIEDKAAEQALAASQPPTTTP